MTRSPTAHGPAGRSPPRLNGSSRRAAWRGAPTPGGRRSPTILMRTSLKTGTPEVRARSAPIRLASALSAATISPATCGSGASTAFRSTPMGCAKGRSIRSSLPRATCVPCAAAAGGASPPSSRRAIGTGRIEPCDTSPSAFARASGDALLLDAGLRRLVGFSHEIPAFSWLFGGYPYGDRLLGERHHPDRHGRQRRERGTVLVVL